MPMPSLNHGFLDEFLAPYMMKKKLVEFDLPRILWVGKGSGDSGLPLQ